MPAVMLWVSAAPLSGARAHVGVGECALRMWRVPPTCKPSSTDQIQHRGSWGRINAHICI